MMAKAFLINAGLKVVNIGRKKLFVELEKLLGKEDTDKLNEIFDIEAVSLKFSKIVTGNYKK